MTDETLRPPPTGSGPDAPASSPRRVAPEAGDGTPVVDGRGALPVATLDDPHLQPMAKNPRRAEIVVAVSLLVGLAGFAAYGGVYWVGGQTQLEGIFLGLGLFGFGFGLSAWGKYLLPQGPFEEDRHPLVSTPAEQEAVTTAVVSRGTMMFRRRGVLGAILGAGAAVMGVVLTFPLLRSLGPTPEPAPAPPGVSLFTTHWRRGSRLVDITGRVIRSGDLDVGGVLTVFPEGFVGSSVDQTILIRASSAPFTTKPGRATWTPEGYVAYSKMCTHAGCPVGLYQDDTNQLLCPCHQSLFNVLAGAVPVFGPAPRPLPQLPLMIDPSGVLRAQQGFDQPVGPGFWERTT